MELDNTCKCRLLYIKILKLNRGKFKLWTFREVKNGQNLKLWLTLQNFRWFVEELKLSSSKSHLQVVEAFYIFFEEKLLCNCHVRLIAGEAIGVWKVITFHIICLKILFLDLFTVLSSHSWR